eukprot:TRINITY_DN8836_c0_g1_i1.p1 TRINITY_DN8836_c0_g1~~TRINITY_DN8836_c0_g1_i1.p1  ORF type:complete len:374 (+),score=75.20 TRINITY_DN8836_c0_g1_i1:110-1231(+)
MGHVEPVDSFAHRAPVSGGMSTADMEDRLRALAQQRLALLEGMKEKLPEKFDPLKFDLQETRNLEPEQFDAAGRSEVTLRPPAEPLAACPEMGDMAKSTTATSNAGDFQFKYSPNVRPSRMQGVDDILSSSSQSLRGKACVPLAGSSSTAARVAISKAKCTPTVLPKANTASLKAQLTPRTTRVPPVPLTPRTTQVASVPKAKPAPSPGGGLTSVSSDRQLSHRGGLAGRPISQGGTAIQQSRTVVQEVQRQPSSSPSRSRASRFGLCSSIMAPKESNSQGQTSSSPSRSRAALLGIAKGVDGINGQRQASSSPSRSRAALLGIAKGVDGIDSQRQASSSPSRSRAALLGVAKEHDVIRDRRMGRQPGQALWK